jgi:ferrous iron transport protein B
MALAGNPNAGKTTIFNAITGARQHVGNWPGVTVEKKEGQVKFVGRELHVVDLPGTYSLTAFSLEEIIARNFIVEAAPDVVVDVVDASNLERNLYLAAQIIEMGVRVVIALNMIDVAQGRQIQIDDRKLSELLGCPVVPLIGKRGVGVPELLNAVVQVTEAPVNDNPRPVFTYGTEVEEELEKIQARLPETAAADLKMSGRWLAMKLLEGDRDVAEKMERLAGKDDLAAQVEKSQKHLEGIFADSPDIILSDARYGFISGALKSAVTFQPSDRVHLSETIDRVLTNRLVGPLILLAILYLVYMFTFQGSEPLVKGFEAFFRWLGQFMTSVLPEGLLRSLIVSGIIDGVGGVLGFTPLIAFMFFAIAILEDTGYLARIAFMLDRVLRGFGLHGASMLALMVSGGLAGGCAVPGIMATRTMKEPKERLVTILVAPLMNCGAKLPVYALLIGAFFSAHKPLMMFLLSLISWALALCAGRVIRSTVLSGPSAPFVLELPPYRLPTLKGLLIHAWERTWMYVKKAGTIILSISVILWALMTFPGLPEREEAQFKEREQKLVSDFLATPEVNAVFKAPADVEAFQQFASGTGSEGAKKAPSGEGARFKALAEELERVRSGSDTGQSDTALRSVASAYKSYEADRKALEQERQATELKRSLGGRMGVALEWVFSPIGFDWRTNIALIGGFAAKEVVVSTLGTAYSLGKVDPGESEGLSEQLQKEPGWNPLMAFTLIMFVMLYEPCLTTLVVIRRETGEWRWSLFAMAYTTILAYVVALVVHSVGSALGLGVS